MITMTDAAISHIQKILYSKDQPKIFRFSVRRAGCSGYRYHPEILDHSQENDIELKISDSLSVFIDPLSLDFINGCTIDYVKQSHGLAQMVFKNPNAINECGCGESFHIKSDSDTDTGTLK